MPGLCAHSQVLEVCEAVEGRRRDSGHLVVVQIAKQGMYKVMMVGIELYERFLHHCQSGECREEVLRDVRDRVEAHVAVVVSDSNDDD